MALTREERYYWYTKEITAITRRIMALEREIEPCVESQKHFGDYPDGGPCVAKAHDVCTAENLAERAMESAKLALEELRDEMMENLEPLEEYMDEQARIEREEREREYRRAVM